MNKILVTGATGMLGQDLCPILEDEDFEVIETGSKTLDITDITAIKEFVKKQNPDCIIHCAAYTNVDGAETDFETAKKINGTGSENLAKVASNMDIPIVYISTDYVFDGEKKEKYETTDKTNPLNNYGKTKLLGELAIQKYCKKYFIVRTSWLYGIHGKNFVETMISLAEKPEIKVVDDQIGCPTWTVDLANAIVDLIVEEPPYGIYNICGSGQTSWYGFAKEIFKLSNLDVNLKPCKTEEFVRPAKRPKNSVLNNNGCCRSWKAALKDYIDLR